MPMASKRGRMTTYLDGLLHVKSLDPLITWHCEITCQTKNIISPIPQLIWPSKPGRMVTYLAELLSL